MKRRILVTLLFFAYAFSAYAHRLNEYLQATTISLTRDSIILHLHLTAGSDVAKQVLKQVDANGDGVLSNAEQQAYAKFVIQNLVLNIDNNDNTLQLVSWDFPSVNEISNGLGNIQLIIAARLPDTRPAHHLILTHQDQQASVVYLVNCLLPADTTIRITGQSRNADQSVYQLDFTTSSATLAESANQLSIDKADHWAVIKTHFVHGVKHILTGYDHLLFLCALVLGAAGLWDLIKIVTAFTIAHSITLTLAVLGYAHLPGYIVEPFISASIVFVAVQNIFWPKQAGGNGRIAVAFLFGLFHGLGFAGGLLELMHAMPAATIVYALLGFSIGVEAGNQFVLVPFYYLLKLAKRSQFRLATPLQKISL
jgi:hydrogenase/urease accessory protein HupE